MPQTPVFPPYQQYSIDFIINHPKCGLFLDMGLGKAIDDETILPTPDGPRKAKDILPGDRLFAMTGEPTQVLAVYHHQNKTAYTVTMEDGRSFICCDEHLIPVFRPGVKTIDPVPLKNLLHVPLDNGPGIRIPWNEPVQYPAQERPFTGTDLGLALQYGRFENHTLDTGKFPEWAAGRKLDKQALFQVIAPCLDETGKPVRMPDWCERTDIQFRCALLTAMAGFDLNDTETCRKLTTLKIELAERTAPAENMAQDIQQIAWSLGHAAEYTVRPRKKTVEISIGFSRIANMETGLKIKSIEPAPPRDMTCFTVADITHTYLMNDYLVTHNTLITLTALWRAAPSGHILVIAPKTIAKATWQNEIAKWGIPVRTKSLVVNERGKDLSRKKRLQLYEETLTEPPTMYFINREKITDLIKNLPKKDGTKIWPFRTVVVDELQSFKNYSSDRTKALSQVAPLCERLIGLTGTPTPQGLMDLWSEIYMLDGGQRLGKNITAYRNRWFKPTMIVNNHPVGWVPLPGAEEEIYALIKDLVISIKNPNIQLPPVTYNDIHVTLDPDEMELYKKFARESALILDDGKTVTAKNAGQLRIKLTQLASGSIYLEKGNSDSYRVIHEKKLDICEYIINNSSGNILIAYQFQADRNMLLNRFKDAVQFDGSPEMLQKWNERKIPIMILNPASAGHGLNMQEGGHTLIWFTTPTNLEFYLQCNARLARQGQPDPVTIHHIIVDKTVDQGNLNLVKEKDEREERLIEAVQAAIDDALAETDESA